MANIKFSALPAGTEAYNDDIIGLTSASVATVVKKVDQTIVSDTTFQDDDELLFTMQANKTYAGLLFLFFQSGVTPDFKYQCTVPVGASCRNLSQTFSGSIDQQTRDMTGSSGNILMTGGIRHLSTNFRVINGANAGDWNFQWAQNTSDPGDTLVEQGSSLIVWEELP